MRKRLLSLFLAFLFLFITIIPHTTVEAEVGKITTPDDVSKKLQGAGTETDPWLISDVESLYSFLSIANDGSGFNFHGFYVKLVNDVIVNDISDFASWTTDSYSRLNVWNGINEFDGTFDGAGHEISGLYIMNEKDDLGFFNYSADSTIQNVVFSSVYVSYGPNKNIGTVVGHANETEISNLKINQGTMQDFTSDEKNALGGIIGKSQKISVSGCTYNGKINGNCKITEGIGGIIGYAEGTCDIISSSSLGKIDFTLGKPAWSYMGGIIGKSNCNVENSAGITVTNCKNEMDISGCGYAGGIAGSIEYKAIDYGDQESKVLQCSNSGNLMSECSGGIVAFAGGMIKIYQSYNVGTVNGNQYSGGVLGYIHNTSCAEAELLDSYNIGDVICENGYSGGIVGLIVSGTTSYTKVSNCFFYQQPEKTKSAYGIAARLAFSGWAFTGATFENVFYPSGIKGYPDPEGEIDWFTVDNVKELEQWEYWADDSFNSFDFTKVWKAGQRYPILSWQVAGDEDISTGEGNFKLVHSLPVIQDEIKAKAFLCFIFNKSADKISSVSDEDNYLKLITGTYDGTDEEKWLKAFGLLQIIEANTEKYSNDSERVKKRYTNALIKYMRDRFDVKEGTSEEAEMEILNSIWGEESKAISDILFGITDYLSYEETYENIDWVYDTFNEIKTARDATGKLENYVKDLSAAIYSIGTIVNSEYAGRYNYFCQYVRMRKLFENPNSDEFQLIKATIAFANQDDNWFAGLIPLITGGNYVDWTQKTDLIDEWAEYTYQLEEAVYNYNIKDNSDPMFKKYTHNQIQCPVDVDVLSLNGDLIASIKNNEIVQNVPETEQDNLFMMVAGDAKHIYINDGANYILKITATDYGTLNYSSSMVQNGEEKIINNTLDVPLVEAKTFEVNYETETEQKTSYAELKENGRTIPITTTNSFDNVPVYQISVNLLGDGEVIGNGEYREGDNVFLRAIPRKGEDFYGWEDEHGRTISMDLVLQFTAIENKKITAKFISKQLSDQPAPSGVTGGNGFIEGTLSAMEYRMVGDEDWTTCSDGTTEVEPGDYEVRMKETDEFAASDPITVTVTKKDSGHEETDEEILNRVFGGAEKITGTKENMEYSPSNSDEWKNCKDGSTEAEPGEYKVRLKATESKPASDPVIVIVTKKVNDEDRPSDSKDALRNVSGGEEKILGTTTNMEYSPSGLNAWSDCSDTETQVRPGKYDVRIKATDNTEASASIRVTVRKAKTAEESKKTIHPDTLEKEEQHTHHYEWKVIREATEEQDGEIDYLCSDCGEVEYRSMLSSFYVFNRNLSESIRQCWKNGTLVVDATKRGWISFSSMVLQALKDRPDVMLQLKYSYKGSTYEMLIPAGQYDELKKLFDKSSVKDSQGNGLYCGYLNLATKYPAKKVK